MDDPNHIRFTAPASNRVVLDLLVGPDYFKYASREDRWNFIRSATLMLLGISLPKTWWNAAVYEEARKLASADVLEALKALREYAELEAEYSRLCDRTQPGCDVVGLNAWLDKHNIRNVSVGQWLAGKRGAGRSKLKK